MTDFSFCVPLEFKMASIEHAISMRGHVICLGQFCARGDKHEHDNPEADDFYTAKYRFWMSRMTAEEQVLTIMAYGKQGAIHDRSISKRAA